MPTAAVNRRLCSKFPWRCTWHSRCQGRVGGLRIEDNDEARGRERSPGRGRRERRVHRSRAEDPRHRRFPRRRDDRARRRRQRHVARARRARLRRRRRDADASAGRVFVVPGRSRSAAAALPDGAPVVRSAPPRDLRRRAAPRGIPPQGPAPPLSPRRLRAVQVRSPVHSGRRVAQERGVQAGRAGPAASRPAAPPLRSRRYREAPRRRRAPRRAAPDRAPGRRTAYG